MQYLPFMLLSPTLLVLMWLYWTYPKSVAVTLPRRLFDALVLAVTLMACVGTSLLMDAGLPPSVDAFGRQSGQIWSQVKPALCGYGVSTALLGVGMLVRGMLWRQRTPAKKR